jgi:hypothetical protein
MEKIMGNNGCPQEPTVARMARTGLWDEAATRHARECPACREVSAAAVRMGSIADTPEAPGAAALPEAGLLWWKHELLARYQQREQAARPVRIMEGITATLAIAALAVGVTLLALNFAQSAESLTDEWLSSVVGILLGGSLAQSALTALTTAAAIGAGILYPLWRER